MINEVLKNNSLEELLGKNDFEFIDTDEVVIKREWKEWKWK